MRLSFRSSGRAAIASGTFGILAIGSLIGYLILRSSNWDISILISRFHDAGVILQFLFMIPVVFGLQKLSQKKNPYMHQATLLMGIGTICLVILFLLLIFPKAVSDILYMLPQGIFGAWLIFLNTRMKGTFSNGLRWSGIIVGLGLVLVGLFPLGFAIFVDPSPLQIPAAPLKDFPETSANAILHQVLFAGSFMGVLMLPFWTIMVGRRLLKESPPLHS